MARPKKLDPEKDREQITKVIYEECGVLGNIAARLGVTRQTMAKVRDDNEWISEAFEDAEEQATDLAHKTVLEAIKTCPKSAQWYLDRKAKDRGFGRETTVHVEKKTQAQVIVYLPDNNRNPHLTHDRPRITETN